MAPSTSSTVPGADRASALADDVPQGVRRDVAACSIRVASAGSGASSTSRPRATRAPCRQRSRRGSGGAARAPERLASRHGAAPAGRAWRCRRRAGARAARARRRPTHARRLHALWTLDGLDAITVAQVEAGTRRMPHHSCVAAAVRIAERWLDAPTAALRSAIEARAPTTTTGACACRRLPRWGR